MENLQFCFLIAQLQLNGTFLGQIRKNDIITIGVHFYVGDTDT